MPTHDSDRETAAAHQGAALFERHDASKIELAGSEARMFLHNLCTQDVKNLAEGAGAEVFLTTAKAKIVAHGAISHVRWQGRNVLWLDADAGQAERIYQHLNHFLISEQVELADRTREVAMLRLVGPAAATMLGAILGGPLPALAPWHNTLRFLDGSEVVVRYQCALNLPGYDCLCPPEFAARLHKRLLSAGAVAASAPTHEILRVEAGWPIYGLDMDESRFVVEVGRIAQAICYTKGCFLGQEPIVMARDRGQVNRMLMGLLCGPGPALPAGTKLFQREAEVGQVTSSVDSPRLGQAIALAYVRRGSQDLGTKVTLESATGARMAVVCALPFASITQAC